MSDLSTTNRLYFDSIAHRYDSHKHTELARRTARAFLNAFPFDPDTTTVMDFACGPGLVSQRLAVQCKTIVGVDISPLMVDVYNERVANQGIPPEEMHAVCADLKGEGDELDGARFDVVACASSYHHFPSIQEITTTLVHFLKPGGVLLVADLLRSPDSDLDDLFDHNTTVAHRGGFTPQDIQSAFEGAGLCDFALRTATTLKKKGRDVVLFIAEGRKPGDVQQ